MNRLYSMFLSQAYQDCWDDYNRSMKLKNFPRWDYVILTASNEEQAKTYREQIAYRYDNGLLPQSTHYAVLPDPEGKRVGSGGATFHVMKYIAQQEPGR